MALLGIDVGTSGCKSAVFSENGELLTVAYEEYDMERPQPGWAQLNSREVWDKVKATVAAAAGEHARSGSPGGADQGALGLVHGRGRRARHPRPADPGPLHPELRRARGALPARAGAALPDPQLYRLNGNTLGNHYSLPKLKWIKENPAELYAEADYLLHWAGFVSFMLGAEPVLDYALANRSLLFDVDRQDWSDALLAWGGLDREKLPVAVPGRHAGRPGAAGRCRRAGTARRAS